MKLDKVKVFGCDAYVHEDKTKRGKFQQRAQPGIFLGYNYQYNAYKILTLDDLKVRVDRDVTFNEESFANMQQVKPQLAQQDADPGDDQKDEYEVEFIDDQRLHEGHVQYLVNWKGYEEPSWEPEYNLTNCAKLLNEYRAHAGDDEVHLELPVENANSIEMDTTAALVPSPGLRLLPGASSASSTIPSLNRGLQLSSKAPSQPLVGISTQNSYSVLADLCSQPA